MSTMINVMLLCAVVTLAARQHKLIKEVDRLRSNTGEAFDAVTRHLKRGRT